MARYATLPFGLAILMASIIAGRATTDGCAVVLNTPDGFLALREGPGTQFRIKDKLRPSQTVGVANEDCIWHRGNVTCNKWIKVFDVDDQTPTSGWAGWVRSKYIQPVAAESCDSMSKPRPPPEEFRECDPKTCSVRPQDAAKPKAGSKPKVRAANQILLPPLKYDRPYTGDLLVMRLASNKDVAMWGCPAPATKFPVRACAIHSMVARADGSWLNCKIIMPVDEVILALGYAPDDIYRHELGHCNGWSHHHPGARVAGVEPDAQTQGQPAAEAAPPQPEGWLKLPIPRDMPPQAQGSQQPAMTPGQVRAQVEAAVKQRADADVPAQYRGLWCEAQDGTYYRCRKATDESSRLIRRDGFNITEEGDCRVNAVRPIAKGHRLGMRCTDEPELVDVNLQLDARGRLHFDRPHLDEPRAEYRHGDPFTLPGGTLMCEAPGGDEEQPEGCYTAREAQVVNLWGKPREGWCLLVHWIDSGKPGYNVAAWKAWADCKNLLPRPRAGTQLPQKQLPAKVILAVEMAMIPPGEYDHPFEGQLTTQVVDTQEQVRQICNMNVYPSIACTFPNPPNGPCKLVRLRATDIQALGWTLEMIERHERAHCNGWPADHAGIRHTPDEWELKNSLGEMFAVIFEDPLVEEVTNCMKTGKKQSVCEKEILEHNPLARQRQKCIRAGLTAQACRKEELRGIP